MANLVYGPLVSGLRGSVGGVTFSQGHSGPTVRQRPRPPRPVGGQQRANQVLLVQAVQDWNGLTVAQKLGWTAYSATVTYYDSLGRAYHPTGMNLYVGVAIMLLRVGANPSGLSAPGASGLATPSAQTWGVTLGALTLVSVVGWPVTGNAVVGSIYGVDVRRAQNRARLLQTFGFNTAMSFPHTFATGIDSAWPSGAQLRVWIKWRQVDIYTRVSTLQVQAVDWVKP